MIQAAAIEDADQVMPLLYAAIGSIAFSLAGTGDEGEALRILNDFYRRPGNRISYTNVLVDKRDGVVAGMLICYPGDEAAALDRPFIERIRREAGRSGHTLDQETKPGDYYLDSLAVHEAYQGQGIAKSLMRAYEARALDRGYGRLALIVEENNAGAHALYEKMGYSPEETLEVSGHRYRRMVKQAGQTSGR
ncbi:GNAT family N-acetyltransferase [Paenibacillus piri]|uniref:GNAT family N-acetyltransferase n=1 Tax=Paenibacillus piri TaxID=2547395 RepID=A0A4R5KM26_9BACL|nr:GNAT family N-acetyltransferase [Paenibacillus piri]TDF96272.1 GNAT family N-acetyltransferase [Paenibacillus piri]